MAAIGQISFENSNSNLSRSVSLSILNRDGEELDFHAKIKQPIELMIPRDPNTVHSLFDWEYVNVSNQTTRIFDYHSIILKRPSSLAISIHLELRPSDYMPAYLLVHRFDLAPQINATISLIDGWTLLCPGSE